MLGVIDGFVFALPMSNLLSAWLSGATLPKTSGDARKECQWSRTGGKQAAVCKWGLYLKIPRLPDGCPADPSVGLPRTKTE